MKTIIKFIFCFTLFLFSCSESNTSSSSFQVTKVKGEETTLMSRYLSEMIANPISQDHIDRNLIVNLLIDSLWDFQKTYSGIYYQIDSPGVSGSPDLNSEIVCHYRGTFLNGKEFDSSFKQKGPAKLKLNAMIAAWQEFIPMLKKGGKGTCIVPSGLAYGEQPPAKSGIPQNAVMKFEIELIDFE